MNKKPVSSSLQALVRVANAAPMLSHEEELKLGRQIQLDPSNADALDHLVASHLRLVISMARKHDGYGIPVEDLIQEGNIGLITAAKKFNPDLGVRFASYAIPWIKSAILTYVLSNSRMVKIATTAAHRKLFFNLNSIKAKIASDDGRNTSLTSQQILQVASELNVRREDVEEMERRMGGFECSVEDTFTDTSDDNTPLRLADTLGNTELEPTEVLDRLEHEYMLNFAAPSALEVLDDRSRQIIIDRWLSDGAPVKTLTDLGSEFGVSAERVRQLESKAFLKMRAALQSTGINT